MKYLDSVWSDKADQPNVVGVLVDRLVFEWLENDRHGAVKIIARI